MKASLMFAILPLLLAAAPTTFAATELDTLRARCAEQERQIRTLEEQLQRLQSGATGQQASAATSATHIVRPGDSLEKIARNQRCSPATLAKLNGLKLTSTITPGQKLKLPGTAPAQTTTSTPASPAALSDGTHKVREGDTFSSISRQYGVSLQALTAANPKVKPTAIRVGQIIRLSADKPTPSVAQSPKPTPAAAPADSPAERPAPAPQETASPNPDQKIRSVTIDVEMTYAEFASKHGTDVGRLNDLNGLDLTNATVLAKGSELYVPAQP